MMKFFFVFVIYLTVATAMERKLEMYYATVYKVDVLPIVSISSLDKIDRNHSVITWNATIDAKTNPLNGLFFLEYMNNFTTASYVPNLCGTYKEGTYQRNAQLLLLKVFANVDACPIKKGTSSVIKEPVTYSYPSKYKTVCGKITLTLALYRETDEINMSPVIMAHFLGYITGCAAERKAEMFSVNIFQTDKYPEISTMQLDDDKKQSTIIWNVPVDAKTNPLKVEFEIGFFDDGKIEEVSLPNLCGNYEEGTFEHRVQLFILKLFANVDACPIKKGTLVLVKEPTTYSYLTDNNNKCGPFESSVKLYRKNDVSKSSPIVEGIFRGEITGC